MVAQTRHGGGGQPSPKKGRLAFSEKLVSKGQSTDTLLKKMKSLHTQLAELDQEQVDINSLSNVRKELVSTSIMLHKDRGVKAYAACCLADILRVYAPEAPYTQAELRDIFEFFCQQLVKGLDGPEATYYNEYYHLLESLSTVKSVVLICDLQDDDLMTKYFISFSSIIRRGLPKKIEIFMGEILVALIDESQTLPERVLEVLQAQFMDEDNRMDQPAYRLAVHVCNATADKLQRQVSQDFSEKIVESAREENFDEVKALHELIKRLNHSCPNLLRSVIPQLEEELRVEDVNIRLIATQTLGEMFCDKTGSDLIKKYPSTWSVWLLRKNDRSGSIRLKFVEHCKGLLTTLLPDTRAAIEESLQTKLFDPDEKVRAAVCRIYSQLDYETVLHHLSESHLRTVAERGADKKQVVRVEALNSLGKLYSLAYPEIESNDPSAIRQFSWIPNEILQMYSMSLEVRAVVEQVVADYILPLPTSVNNTSGKGLEVDEIAWTDRLLNTMKYLGEKAINALLGLTGLRYARPNPFDIFLESCIQNNGGIIDEDEERIKKRLRGIIQHISQTFPDPQKASDDLHSFAKLNENRLYKLLKTCMDPNVDLKSLIKATAEFERRMEQSSSNITPNMLILLRRASFRIFNQSSIPTLIKRITTARAPSSLSITSTPSMSSFSQPDPAVVIRVQTLLTFASKHCPAIYKSHVGELTKAIADEKNKQLVEAALQALACLVKWDSNLFPNDRRTKDRIVKLASSSNHRHAKFAARLLAHTKKSSDTINLVETVVDDLPNCADDALVARITVLTQLAKFAPEAFESKSDVIMAFLLKQVLMVPIPAETPPSEEVEEWAQDEEITPQMQAKVQAVKVCRRRCMAHAGSEKALELAAPVLKLLASLLEHQGSLAAGGIKEDPKIMSRMRLQAGVSLLHLSTVDAYAMALAPKFSQLAVTVQDSCYNVRISFLTKLITLLQQRKLPSGYNIIPFLTVHDPEAEVKVMAQSYVQNSLAKLPPAMKIEQFEIIFIRFLHLLAHHPDFNKAHADLMDIAKYVQFYLDQIATPDTVSLLYHLALKGKTVRDADSHTHSENFYVVCELAQELIKSRAQTHAWAIHNYPGKVRLPSDILRPLPNPEAANKIVKTVYLPDETLKWATDLARGSQNKEKKERKTTGKRKAPAKTNGTAKRRAGAKRRRAEEEDEESEPSDTVSSDVEMEDAGRHKPPPTSDEEGGESGGDGGVERPGRAARTLAKARIKKQTRGRKKEPKRERTESPLTEEDDD